MEMKPLPFMVLEEITSVWAPPHDGTMGSPLMGPIGLGILTQTPRGFDVFLREFSRFWMEIFEIF